MGLYSGRPIIGWGFLGAYFREGLFISFILLFFLGGGGLSTEFYGILAKP